MDKEKEVDRETPLGEFAKIKSDMSDLLVVMMGDLIKIDQRDNFAAAQRLRVNSLRFQKLAKRFRKASISLIAR